MTDEIVFAEETAVHAEGDGLAEGGVWKLMIVDDNEDVHNVTRLVFEEYVFEGRPVICLSAYSGKEAMALISEHPDTAVMLLDVVMETNTAGLDVAHYIRSEAANPFVRIIMRTGQPGYAPVHEVVAQLDINDYHQKTELTADRLALIVTMAFRSYRDIKTLNENRRGLHMLAMSVAHQVRNRIIAIAGFANIIKRKESVCPGLGDHLDTILYESSRLEVMVGDVTGYASVKRGELLPSSIRDMLEKAMETVENRLGETGGTVHWDVFCPDQTVLVDPALFVLAFEAILQNSVDFSGDDPKVKIAVTPDRLACIIKVVDFGCGIAAKDLPFVYDPFFSLKPEGSGMGLCVVKKVAIEHLWELSMESDPGMGTTVTVVIPRRELTG